MIYLVLTGVLLLAFANGANDNFKGVATLWGTARYRYRTVLAWATLTTFAGSVAGVLLARGLVKVFNGSQFLGKAASIDPVFLAAVALGAGLTVLLASRIGAPISTTHALAGGLVGAGVIAVGAGGVEWTALLGSIALPLLFSPLLALGLTVVAFPALARWIRTRSCICLIEPAPAIAATGETASAAAGFFPSLRIVHHANCNQGDEMTRWNTEELIHWSSAGLISFSRGLNDTPKIAALVLSTHLLAPALDYVLVAAAMALGGLAAAARVARTMSQRVTRIEPVPGMTANLAAALLVGLASRWSVPVSTTHVTLGGIFGVGIRRRDKTNWSLVRQIILAWVITLPMGLAAGLAFYYILSAMT